MRWIFQGALFLFFGLVASGQDIEASRIATNTFVASARSAYVYSVVAYNSSASDLYLLVFDSASAPSAGDRPTLAPVKVPGGSTASFTDQRGVTFYSGVAVACSSTDRTYTNGGLNFIIHVNKRQTAP